MKAFWKNFNYFIFYPKFNFFDYMMIWSITTLAVGYSWWFMLALVPVILFSAKMEWRVRKENDDAQASNGTVR